MIGTRSCSTQVFMVSDDTLASPNKDLGSLSPQYKMDGLFAMTSVAAYLNETIQSERHQA